MKNYVVAVGLLLSGLSLAAQNTDVTPFEWLIGSWEGEQDGGILQEQWKKKDDHTLIGQGYFLVNRDTIVNEAIRFEKIAGHWCFIASINGKAPVLFTLVESTAEKWVFENKEHDFPQRLVYSKGENGSLLAWIEGEAEGKFSKESYRLEKID